MCCFGARRQTVLKRFYFVDIDECVEGVDLCDKGSTTCRNLAGGYSCDCKSGYEKGGDRYKCNGNGLFNRQLFSFALLLWFERGQGPILPAICILKIEWCVERGNSEKKSEFHMGFEPTTFHTLVGCSNHWATRTLVVSDGHILYSKLPHNHAT